MPWKLIADAIIDLKQSIPNSIQGDQAPYGLVDTFVFS